MNADNSLQPLRAALLMILAMAVIGVIDNYIRIMAAYIGLWQFHLVRASMALPLIALLSLVGIGRFWPVRWWAVGLRSLFVGLSMLCYFSALALMPIAEALAGLFTSPIFIVLITALFLKPRIGPWRILAVAVGFAGVLLVLQFDARAFRPIILLPVAGGFFYALGALATRSLCAGESTLAMLAGMMAMLGLMGGAGLIMLAINPVDVAPGADGFLARGWVWPIGPALPIVVMQAVGSVAGVFCIIRAYQIGEASFVGVFEYSVMIFGPAFAFLAFGQGVSLWQGVGIALIVLAGAVIAMRSE